MFDANEKKKKKSLTLVEEHDGLELRANDEILCSAEPNEWRSNDFLKHWIRSNRIFHFHFLKWSCFVSL